MNCVNSVILEGTVVEINDRFIVLSVVRNYKEGGKTKVKHYLFNITHIEGEGVIKKDYKIRCVGHLENEGGVYINSEYMDVRKLPSETV